MMNHDEKFPQLWDVRKGENDIDSSSDNSKSNSSGELMNKKLKLFTGLVLPETELSDTPRDNGVHFRSVGATRARKVNSCKKKNSVQSKAKKGSVKENKRMKINLNHQDVVALEDLKTFSNSVIHELKISRENMFAQMKEEMDKLVTSRLVLVPKKKNGVLSRKGVELSMKPSFSGGASTGENLKYDVKSSNAVVPAKRFDTILDKTNEAQNSEILRQPSKNLMVVSNNLDPAASLTCLTLPNAVPKPQLQNYQSSLGLSSHISTAVPRNNSGSKIDVGRMMDAKSYCHELAPFLPEEHFGGLSNMGLKNAGFLGRNCSRVENMGVGFPIPLHQGLNNGSKLSSHFYHKKSLPSNSKVGQIRSNVNEKFNSGSQVFSECSLPSSINGNMHYRIARGEFVSVRSPNLECRQL